MDIVNLKNKSLSRRRALRIYQPVDMSYQKISSEAENGTNVDLTKAPDFLPDTENAAPIKPIADPSLAESKNHENDALNVNISASGISFTCKEELKTDDCLILRIRLLPSIKAITVSCKVIYCKPSNPFEKDRYPYLVGVCFVNIKEEDTELLHKYVNKKRKQQLTLNGLLAAFLITMIGFPDVIFDFLVGLFDLFIENFIEAVHLLFELIEYNLDHLVEFLFHTNVHDTQTIVFYIIIGLSLLGLYIFIRTIPPFFIKQWRNYRLFIHRKKSSFLYCWREKPLMYKISVISAAIIASTCYVMFFI
ncbi:MAG: hypothetical protein GQ548_01720 [Methylophaga sp.]|nr:hypothetical protein [Methylophaga sp.]